MSTELCKIIETHETGLIGGRLFMTDLVILVKLDPAFFQQTGQDRRNKTGMQFKMGRALRGWAGAFQQRKRFQYLRSVNGLQAQAKLFAV